MQTQAPSEEINEKLSELLSSNCASLKKLQCLDIIQSTWRSRYQLILHTVHCQQFLHTT